MKTVTQAGRPSLTCRRIIVLVKHVILGVRVAIQVQDGACQHAFSPARQILVHTAERLMEGRVDGQRRRRTGWSTSRSRHRVRAPRDHPNFPGIRQEGANQPSSLRSQLASIIYVVHSTLQETEIPTEKNISFIKSKRASRKRTVHEEVRVRLGLGHVRLTLSFI